MEAQVQLVKPDGVRLSVWMTAYARRYAYLLIAAWVSLVFTIMFAWVYFQTALLVIERTGSGYFNDTPRLITLSVGIGVFVVTAILALITKWKALNQ